MMRFKKAVNITTVFVIIGVFLCSEVAYPLPKYLLGKLRVPISDNYRIKEYLEKALIDKVMEHSPVKASAVTNQLVFNIAGVNIHMPEVANDKDLINMQVVAVKSILDEKLFVGGQVVDTLFFIDALKDEVVGYAVVTIKEDYIIGGSGKVFDEFKRHSYMERAIKLLLLSRHIERWQSSPSLEPPANRMYQRIKENPRFSVQGDKGSGYTIKLASGQNIKTESIDFAEKMHTQTLASGDTLKQGLIKLVELIDPIVSRIVELATAKVGFDTYDQKVTVSEYPLYGCAVGSIAVQYMLERLYGERIKVEIIELSHPKMEELEIGMHVTIIIYDNITGKKYFMSFFEGIWDDSYPYEKTREIEFYLSDGSNYRDFFATPEYIEWFKRQAFSPVFFEFIDNRDITEKTGLTVLGKYKYEELEESEVTPIFSAIGSIVDFDALRFLLNRDNYLTARTIRTGC